MASARTLLHRPPTERELAACRLYERLHAPVAALGLLFVVLVLAQSATRDGTVLQTVLLVGTWVLWAVFVAEYALRAVIAPNSWVFLRNTWWQLLLLVIPVLTVFRALLLLRLARPTRVALAAVRAGRSARATLGARAGWLGVLTAIAVFGAADVLYRSGAIQPYSAALHGAALSAISGEPLPSDTGLAQVLDVILSAYSVVVFASLAGILGAYFLDTRSRQEPVEANHHSGGAAG